MGDFFRRFSAWIVVLGALSTQASAPLRHLILSTATFEERGSEAGVEGFLKGVYAFDPKGWIINRGKEQPNSTYYPPVTEFNSNEASVKVVHADREEELQAEMANLGSLGQLRHLYWITHGNLDGELQWMDGYHGALEAKHALIKSTKLPPWVEIEVFHCFMDKRGEVTPPQLYVQDIWPRLKKDSTLKDVQTRKIADRPNQGGTIIIGDRVIVIPPKAPKR
jgi:hypothetical protein